MLKKYASSLRLDKKIKDLFGQPYDVSKGVKLSLRLERVGMKDDGGFMIHKAVQMFCENGLSVFNTSSDVDLEQFNAQTTGCEAIVEFYVPRAGLYKLLVYLNDRALNEPFFVETRKGKLVSMDEQLNTTQHSMISKDTGLNSSQTSNFGKRPRSSFRVSSKVLIKPDGKLILKNGSIQPMKTSQVIAVEEPKRSAIKDIIAGNKGKLEKYIKAKKTTVLPSIKRVT